MAVTGCLATCSARNYLVAGIELAAVKLTKLSLVVLVSTFLALSTIIALPFVQYILGAVLLAYVLYPIQKRLEPYASPMAVALSLVVLSVAGVIIPAAIVVATLVDSADRILRNVEGDLPLLETVESNIEELTGVEVDLLEEITAIGREAGTVVIERSTEVFGTVTFHIFGITLVLFLVYYLLKDGDELLAWLDQTIPLPDAQRRELYSGIDGVMWGVIFGHVFVGVVQGIVAGAGLLATGVDTHSSTPRPFSSASSAARTRSGSWGCSSGP